MSTSLRRGVKSLKARRQFASKGEKLETVLLRRGTFQGKSANKEKTVGLLGINHQPERGKGAFCASSRQRKEGDGSPNLNQKRGSWNFEDPGEKRHPVQPQLRWGEKIQFQTLGVIVLFLEGERILNRQGRNL